jgi:membrane protease YdiL (CAAX protease family)
MTTLVDKDRSGLLQEKRQAEPAQQTGQYTFWQIIAIWLAGGAPMWILGWLIYPVLRQGLPVADAGLLRIKLMTTGLIWQFVLSMLILHKEEGDIRIETISRRFWLNNLISSKTGEKNNRLWWLILPLILLVVAMESTMGPVLDSLWIRLFPFLAELQGYSMEALFAPDLRAMWIGAWDLVVLTVVFLVFNTVLGEEFLFRGVLLPKINGAFGKWNWAANGFLFGLYHIHQPWGCPGIFCLVYCSHSPASASIVTGSQFSFTPGRACSSCS